MTMIFDTTMQCMECERELSIEEAEEAVSDGCPGCGGTDIDIAI